MRGKIFLIADTHFGDDRIIKYENRPFADSAHMDGEMASNWNKTVGPEDKVFVLGDFSAYGKDKTREICRLLSGEKILIKGNHDVESNEYYRDCGFKEVSEFPVIFKEFWMLSHYPLYINENMPYANIFGHIHGNPAYKDCSGFGFCVSAERIGYTPINFEEIKKRVGSEK